MLEPIVVAARPQPPANGHEPKLSPRQQTLIAYIEHNPKFAAFNTASELAHRVGVHPATVVRLAQMLGYRGFPEFQEAVRHRYLASLDAVAIMNAHAEERHGDVALASLDQDIRNLAATRGSLDRDALRAVARAILRANLVLAVGAGSHAGLALIFAHLCQFMGLPAEAEVRGGVSLATRLAKIGPGDVVLGTSAWWVIEETRTALVMAREQGAITVAIVDNPMSGLAEVADHVLIARTESVSFYQSMAGPLAALNALVCEIAAIGENELRERMAATNRSFERLGVARQASTTFLTTGVSGSSEQMVVLAEHNNGIGSRQGKEGTRSKRRAKPQLN
ncbi:MAG: MurR/RpiR family transcriptional regulator [Thermomicrobiales bacterium]